MNETLTALGFALLGAAFFAGLRLMAKSLALYVVAEVEEHER